MGHCLCLTSDFEKKNALATTCKSLPNTIANDRQSLPVIGYWSVMGGRGIVFLVMQL